jgi:hypothetical protein
VVGCHGEAYSFLDGNFRYHHISIAPKDRYKTSFITNWGAFIWRVMPFGVNNEPSTFQKVVTKALKNISRYFYEVFFG